MGASLQPSRMRMLKGKGFVMAKADRYKARRPELSRMVVPSRESRAAVRTREGSCLRAWSHGAMLVVARLSAACEPKGPRHAELS